MTAISNFFAKGASSFSKVLRKGAWNHKPFASISLPMAATVLTTKDCVLFDRNGYYRRGISTGARTVWIISYTPVNKEPRVIRQARALENAGWRVVVLGLPGDAPPPEGWHFVALLDRRMSHLSKMLLLYASRVLRLFGAMLVRFGAPTGVKRWGAQLCQRATPSYGWRRKTILKFFETYQELRPDLVLCHDYFTTDVALEVTKRARAAVVVDCHEYALGQFAHNPRWLRWHRPVVKALQEDWYARVDGVTTVCTGIAELITADQALRRAARVVRSVPFFVQQPFRPTGDVITVLYHGEIFPTRALHVAVRSLHLWRPEFRLVLRGYADPDYAEQLRQIAAETGVSDRLLIEPPVSFDRIVPAANAADIGYFAHVDSSPQRRFALPNKFFEYVMAGLALVVSDLPEMARLVKEHNMGALISDCDEENIARAINTLDRATIDQMKRNSLKAAQDLNWEKEKEKMMALYEEILA